MPTDKFIMKLGEFESFMNRILSAYAFRIKKNIDTGIKVNAKSNK